MRPAPALGRAQTLPWERRWDAWAKVRGTRTCNGCDSRRQVPNFRIVYSRISNSRLGIELPVVAEKGELCWRGGARGDTERPAGLRGVGSRKWPLPHRKEKLSDTMCDQKVTFTQIKRRLRGSSDSGCPWNGSALDGQACHAPPDRPVRTRPTPPKLDV